jgi:ABC-type glycerol-3-phosphate transport system substrate-binding protein
MNVAAMKWSMGFGGGFAKKGVPTANDPKTVEGIKFWKELYDSPFFPKGLGDSALRQLIWEGKLAMFIDGAWIFGIIKSKNPEIYKYLDAALPPTPTRAAIVGGAFWGISGAVKNIEATWKVMEALNTPEWQMKYLEMTTQIPGQKGMVSKGFLMQNPWMKIYDEAAEKYSAGHGYIPEGFDLVAERYHQIVADYLARIFVRNAPVKETLDELQGELLKTFKK